jgi:hypothetical protein
MRRHLILALNAKGLGEGILGVNLAADLHREGDEVCFLAHESNDKLFASTDYPRVTFGDAASPLLTFYLKDCVERFHPASIILSDFSSAMLFLQVHGQSPEILTRYDLPIFAIDTWGRYRIPENDSQLANGASPSSGQADGAPGNSPQMWEMLSRMCGAEESQDLAGAITALSPVPFLARNGSANSYQALPEAIRVDKRARDRMRDSLGLETGSKAVLFCTAQWQHIADWRFPCLSPAVGQQIATNQEQAISKEEWIKFASQWNAAQRLASALPVLLAEYLSQTGKAVHLIHVGPRPYVLGPGLNERYRWLAPLPPCDFNALLAAVDLVVSANISATTIAKCMVLRVPTLVLQNSISASTRQAAEESLKTPLSPWMVRWLEGALPLLPFALWPLGYHRFLEAILADNPYRGALDVAEILDESQVKALLEGLLFNGSRHDDQMQRQASYLSHVRSLPTGAQLVRQTLGN